MPKILDLVMAVEAQALDLLLFVLSRATRAQNILELRTATGYSTIYLGRGCEPAEGRVLTLEFDAELAKRARKNIALANLPPRRSLFRGSHVASLDLNGL